MAFALSHRKRVFRDFPTRMFRGMEINHQYNKSYEFEARLIEVINRRLVEGVTCFSVLRPFYELRLGALFSRLDQYLEVFPSCNKGMGERGGVWCKACPKCAFVFLILYPFLDASQRERAFGENLFYRAQIRTLMLDLVSPGRKPWECVGTLGREPASALAQPQEVSGLYLSGVALSTRPRTGVHAARRPGGHCDVPPWVPRAASSALRVRGAIEVGRVRTRAYRRTGPVTTLMHCA